METATFATEISRAACGKIRRSLMSGCKRLWIAARNLSERVWVLPSTGSHDRYFRRPYYGRMGGLWAKLSGGRRRFMMVKEQRWDWSEERLR